MARTDDRRLNDETVRDESFRMRQKRHDLFPIS